MGKIYSIIGKSSTGKDTIYQRILLEPKNKFCKIVPYTTRPIRDGEENGVAYFFVSEDKMHEMEKENCIIECRAYHTIHGIWYYFTAKDDQIQMDEKDYLVIGTIESYQKMKEYFGEENVIPIYIELEDGERLTRALCREKQQLEPKYEEMCRRFLADNQDFSEENLQKAGISRRFVNDDLEECIKEIQTFIDGERNKG